MTLYFTKIKNSIFILAGTAFLLASFGVLLPITAHAVTAPFGPGCYRPDGTEYKRVECETAVQTKLVENSGKCYLGDATGGLWEINCQTLENIEGTEPSTSGQELEINDCDNVNIRAGAAVGSDEHCGILNYIVIGTNFLSVMVGIVVIGSIIFGGIQYSRAGSDPQKVAAAKERIRNAIIALVFFIFTYSFLNYLIPGGLF